MVASGAAWVLVRTSAFGHGVGKLALPEGVAPWPKKVRDVLTFPLPKLRAEVQVPEHDWMPSPVQS